MRNHSRHILPILLLASAACTLPERDNRRDPSKAPSAHLAIVDVALDQGVCALTFASSAAPVVSSSRGACLALDASLTSDPQGSALASLDFHFEVVQLDELGHVEAVLEPLTTGGEPVTHPGYFLIPASVRLNAPLGAEYPLSFRVTVTDPSDAYDTTVASVVLENGAPEAARIEPVSLPVGGLPWAAGVDYLQHFDATTSTDPDGDPLTYCWRFPPTAPPATACTLSPDASGFLCAYDDPDDPCFTRLLEADTPHRYSAELYVHDNPDPALRLSSPTELQSVSVRAQDIWTIDGTNFLPHGFTSLPADFAELALPISYPSGATFLDRSAIVDAVAFLVPSASALGPPFQLRLHSWPGALGAGNLFPAFGGIPIIGATVAASPDGTQIWGLGIGQLGAIGHIDRWDVPTSLAATTRTSLGSVDLVEGTDLALYPARIALLVTDGDGNAWASSRLSPRIYPVDRASGVLPPIERSGSLVSGLAARPGTSEVWASWRPDEGSGAPPALVAYDALGAVANEIVLPVAAPLQIGWIHETELWLSSFDRGLLRVDISHLLATGDFESSVLAELPVPADADYSRTGQLIIDPASGRCLVPSLALGETRDAAPDGTMRVLETAAQPLLVDPEGAVWFEPRDAGGLPESRVVRSFTIDIEQEVARSTLIPSSRSTADVTTGGLWTATLLPAQLLRLSADGLIRKQIKELQLDGVMVPMMPFSPIAFAPDGSTAWGVDANTLYHVDLRQDPAVATVVLAAAGITDLEALPAGSGVPRVWGLIGPNIVSIDIDGTTTVAVPLPGGLTFVDMARAPSSGDLCVAFQNDPAPINVTQARVDIVRQDGTTSILGTRTLSLTDFQHVDRVAGAADSDEEVCWLLMGENLGDIQLYAFSTASVAALPIHSYVSASGGFLPTMFPLSPHTTWTKAEFKTSRLEFNPIAGGALVREVAVPVLDTRPLVEN